MVVAVFGVSSGVEVGWLWRWGDCGGGDGGLVTGGSMVFDFIFSCGFGGYGGGDGGGLVFYFVCGFG